MDDTNNERLRLHLSVPIVQSNIDNDKFKTFENIFMPFQHKSHMNTRENKSGKNTIATILSLQNSDENNETIIENVLNEEINYKDLGTLCDKDLELLGFNNPHQREELLKCFKDLPSQDISFESILKLRESERFNQQIIKNGLMHLDTMRCALSLADYKMQSMPPEDVVIAEKNFASNFVLQALTELESRSESLDATVLELEKVIKRKNIVQENIVAEPDKRKFFSSGAGILLSTCLSTLLVFLVIKNIKR